MKYCKALFCLILVFVCMCGAAAPVLAAQNGSLTIVYEQEDVPLVDATFSLYLVAWEEGGQLVVAEEFAKYHVNITPDESTWPALASTLEAYAAFGGITPLRQGKTNEQGLLIFPDLPDGIYLITGGLHRQNGRFYTAEAALVTIDGKNIEAFPKAEWVPDGGGDEWEEETLKVLKIWKDGEGENRPQSVTVHLLQDGRIYDTVVLSEANNWRHTWQELPAGHSYAVVEEYVDGYTVTVRRQGVTFVVTNTADGQTPPPDAPPDQPGEIPKTGQPWAYVLILAAAGLLMLVVGLYIRRGGKHEA